ncbi:MAG: nucleoside deaminase [Pirellulaceae bacterium]
MSDPQPITPQVLMRLAIDKCAAGIELGQTPFGCAIALEGRVIAVSHNTVWQTIDITAHAEINALRAGCEAISNPLLEGAIVATTCEPCPMCAAALHWARVGTVYYGATIADAVDAGFSEIDLPAEEVFRRGKRPVHLEAGLLRDECRELFARWQDSPQRREY